MVKNIDTSPFLRVPILDPTKYTCNTFKVMKRGIYPLFYENKTMLRL